MNFETFLIILEFIGAIAFAISGALIAIENKMDLLGVILLGTTTAVGGGLFRDIIIGRSMPLLFSYPWYALAAVITTIFVFLILYFMKNKHLIMDSKIYQVGFNITDSLGLGVFVVVGAVETMNVGVTNHFMIVFCSVLTAVGGGMLRDMMAAKIPAIFRKHIYCVAAIVGALFYYIMYINTSLHPLAAILTILIVVVIRFLAFYFKLNLPKVPFDVEENQNSKH